MSRLSHNLNISDSYEGFQGVRGVYSVVVQQIKPVPTLDSLGVYCTLQAATQVAEAYLHRQDNTTENKLVVYVFSTVLGVIDLGGSEIYEIFVKDRDETFRLDEEMIYMVQEAKHYLNSQGSKIRELLEEYRSKNGPVNSDRVRRAIEQLEDDYINLLNFNLTFMRHINREILDRSIDSVVNAFRIGNPIEVKNFVRLN